MPMTDLFDPSSGDPYRGGLGRPPAYIPGGGGTAQGAAGGGFGDLLGSSAGYRPFVGGAGLRRRVVQPGWVPGGFNPGRLPAGPVSGPDGGGGGGAPAGFWDLFSGGGADVGDWNRLLTMVASGNGPAGTMFDPNGDPREMQAISEMGQVDALDRGRRGYLLAQQESPNDPGLAGYMRLKGQLGAMSDSSRMAGSERLAARQRQEAFARMLMQMIGSSNLQRGLANQNYGLQNSLQQSQQGGGFGDWLGNVGGGALGSWLSPGGFWGKKN